MMNKNIMEQENSNNKTYNFNDKTDEERSKETQRMRKNTKNIIDNKRLGRKLNEETEENKELFESINSSSDIKMQAYDYLSEIVGIDLYKTENKREVKKVYRKVNEVKKTIKTLEHMLNGNEVYRAPSLNNEALISYLSSVDPKKKGLYFQFNECRDITIMFKNKEIEHKNYMIVYEQQLEQLDKKLEDVQGTSQIDSLKSISKERMEIKRKMELHARDLEGIYNDLNSYVIKSKHIENKICEFQNALNASRILSNNMELSLSIIEPDYMSGEGKTLNGAINNLKELQKASSKFKKFIEEYAINKTSKTDRLYNEIDKSIKDDNGEEISNIILAKNKSVFDYSKANMKAMRDTYFKDLGY